MAPHNFAKLDTACVPTPCHVLDLARLEHNLQILKRVGDEAGVSVLLALKAFSCFAVSDLVMKYLSGTAASGLYEARLGRTRFGGDVHAYAPGLKDADIDELLDCSDHLILNSLQQWGRFRSRIEAHGGVETGLRVNPMHSEVENPLYDPCASWSRLGAPANQVTAADLEGLSGIHVHALCDHPYDAFDRMLSAVEARCAHLFGSVEWINLGGGLLITDDGFPLERFIERLAGFRERTGLKVYIEPGTAVALHAGALVSQVLDRFDYGAPLAVMDTSATCHMPDVIEAPFTPDLLGATALPRNTAMDAVDAHVIRLGGPTCLAGDIIGTYRFEMPPQVGDRLVFLDLAYYTMVKATTFNGMPLPSLALWDSRTDALEVVKSFGYADFEGRL
ncbi:carboxynorspermidine decarboxylase [Hoeflea sp. WL0058]|uniref:Carboxynorspermidine/carboxyspermidine decarboxylase n=1 Tax=Flavimaribacter sediminis TaxID=2865987 RepID=A0AAE2ZKD8_9HYPH|nr:carboxynorspermidine decarboxylase [Flavimaribacter sediminis]MBW8637796.1 carboxynorspermidine decarboxylase [Flavimaribacter sediminis]